MTHMDIINNITDDVKMGFLRDKLCNKYSENQFQLFCIMEKHINLWPEDFVAKGKSHHPRYVANTTNIGRIIEAFLAELNIGHSYVSVGGGPKKRGTMCAVVPKVFWDAVKQELKDKEIDTLGRLMLDI